MSEEGGGKRGELKFKTFTEITYDYSSEGLMFKRFTYDSSLEGLKFIKTSQIYI